MRMYSKNPRQHDEVLVRIAAVEEALHGMYDAGLMVALMHPDEDTAQDVLELIRDAWHSHDQNTTMFHTDTYLEHLDKVIGVAERLGRPRATTTLRGIKDYFLDNYTALQRALGAVRQEEQHDGLRENYYLN